ncbi:hypothetical protein AO385_1274 [Moraxella catarrhalis]|nr:hypothetical protein AO385_1274 [Moraxella catarrhalis]
MFKVYGAMLGTLITFSWDFFRFKAWKFGTTFEEIGKGGMDI